MLKIINLSKSYNNQLILKDINLAVKNGEVVTIVGKSGSGKSTLLRIIAGLELPMKGKIKLQNKTVNDGNTFINPEKRNCSLVFQDYALFPNLTVEENIYLGKSALKSDIKIKDLINIAGISALLNKYPHQCSGGEQQRIAIVRSMAVKPGILLMDEPLSNLDYELKFNLRQIIKKLLIESKTTALIVTHDIYDVMEFSDRLIVLEKGHIIQEGVPNEVFKNPNSKETALLFGKANFIPLKYLKDSKRSFLCTKDNIKYVCIRPEQFKIKGPSVDQNKSFEGIVKSIEEKGFNHQVVVDWNGILIDVHVNSKLKIKKDQKINFYPDLDF